MSDNKENKPKKSKKKEISNTYEGGINEIITALNFQNLTQEMMEEMSKLMDIEDINERQRKRMEISKNVYSTLFSEMINRICFSPNFLEDIESLPIDKRLDLMMKLAKYNYDQLKTENQKLMAENEKIQIIINQDAKIHEKKKSIFENMYQRYSNENKLELLNEALNEDDDEDLDETNYFIDEKDE